MSIEKIEQAATSAASRLSQSGRPTISVWKPTTRTLPKKWWQSKPQTEESEDRADHPWWGVFLWPFEMRMYTSQLHPSWIIFETRLQMLCINRDGQFGISSSTWFEGTHDGLSTMPPGQLLNSEVPSFSIGPTDTASAVAFVTGALSARNNMVKADAPWGGSCDKFVERLPHTASDVQWAERRLVEALEGM